MKLPLLFAALCLATVSLAADENPTPDRGSVVQPWHPKAPPLPAPTGQVRAVSTVDELERALENAAPGSTVLVADGHYPLTRALQIRADGVTLRSASGQRDRVVLDGAGRLGEGIRLTHCTGATIADLTVENIHWNGIKIDSESGVQRATIYNCVLHNIWQRGIKGVAVPKERRDSASPSDFVIRYCLFHNDRPKRYTDDPDDTAANFQGNYIAGIDAMFVRQWTISDNVFIGIQGRTGEGRGAVFLWQDSRDCVIERNVILDCDAGICLGNPQRSESDQVHCSGFVVRNNFLTRVPENGIFAVYTRNCKIVHNTIYDPESRRGRLIRVLNENPGLIVQNNLMVGPPISNEMKAPLDVGTNIVLQRLDVADAQNGNLRFEGATNDAVQVAAPLPDAEKDIDGQDRGPHPTAGAYELKR